MTTPNRIHRLVRLAIAGTTAVALPLAAHAGYKVSTSAGTYVGFSRGCDATYNAGYGQGSVFRINGTATSCPDSPWSLLDGATPVEIVYDGVVDAAGTRTSSWDRTFQGINNRNSVASARSAADLATGSLHSFAEGGGNDPGGGGSRAAVADTSLRDTLHFSIAGANAATQTLITVRMTLDGKTADFAGASSMDLDWVWNFGSAQVWDQGSNFDVASNSRTGVFTASKQTDKGWYSFTRLANTMSPDNTDIVVEGQYVLTGASTDIEVGGRLYVAAENAMLDYENTGKLSLVLPGGVSFTSDSGVFLSTAPVAAVPEPATWALMALGLAGMGLRSRRRDQA